MQYVTHEQTVQYMYVCYILYMYNVLLVFRVIYRQKAVMLVE